MSNQHNKAELLFKRIKVAVVQLEEAGENDSKRKQVADRLKVEIHLACKRGNVFAMGLLTNRVGSFEAEAGYLHYDFKQKEKVKEASAHLNAFFAN